MVRMAVRLALWLVPIHLVVIGAMPLLGPHRPPRDAGLADAGFAACKLPCWAGVVPGVTPFAEANRLLSSHLPPYRIPTFLTTSTLSFETINSAPAVSGVLFYEQTRVGAVHLATPVPLWYLLETLGTPDCVWVSQGGAQALISIFWERSLPSTGAYFPFAERAAWELDMPARFLQMSSTSSCATPGALPWRGFAPAWRYGTWAGD